MAGGEETGTRIVSAWSDGRCATGDCYYETSDGRVWKRELSPRDTITGETRGYVRDGRIHRT